MALRPAAPSLAGSHTNFLPPQGGTKGVLMKHILPMLMLCALMLSLLCACGAPASETDTTAATTTDAAATETTRDPALIALVDGDEPLYRVIRAEEPTTAAFDAARAVREYMVAQSGAEVSLGTDWVRRDSDPDAEPSCEILVGATNRTASAAALSDAAGDAWCVTMVGERIVIHATAGYLLEQAIAYFESICVMADGVLMLDSSKCKVEVIPNQLLEADITLRVGSFNIKHGAQVGLNMAKLAEDIRALDLDIVGLQEVDMCTSRVKGADTLKELADALGYPYYQFTRAIDYGGGEYGTAILSRYPIIAYETVPLQTAAGYEARAFGHARIEVNGAQLSFFNTHLSYEKRELRDVQFAQLAESVNAGRGYILTGDFNTADLTEFGVFPDATLVNEGQYATFPGSSSAIDNIVLESGWRIVESGMLATVKSDHNLLWAEIHYGD